ncbi:iron-sulfur assembly protein IscA, chloroplastic [Cicer arietinum]|uniref:Iron-sulfur assembly protein IscA, chloroplastic n=1 Tax=Cicer arietinum TaxID=3827 RepID=A0A1S2YFE7_CICAR|nr:iron-sulfur assembly protein IscA, chloroplastic [Cicer arietinum]
MAFSATITSTHYSPQFLRVPISVPLSQTHTSLSFRSSTPILNRRIRTPKPLSIRSVSIPAAPASGAVAPAISLTDNALSHLNKMRSERSQDLCLRIGVKQGGCSGMSYTMDFEDKANTRPDDSIIEYQGFVIVCDPKSLLFIFGMQLDYSDALIGGGFSFKNPNATQTCGCGKSFNAEM